MTKNKKLTLGAVAFACVLGGCYVLFAQGAGSPINTATAATSAQTSSDQSAQAPEYSAPIGSRKKAAPAVEYSQTKNINSYINSLSAASSPPGALEIAQAKAWDECGFLIKRPNSAKLDIANLQAHGGKYAEFRVKALQQLDMRCKDFAFSTQIKRNDAEALYQKSANKGNAEALARNLVNGVSTLDPSKSQQSVIQVLSANDPAALFTMADVFGDQGPFEMTAGGEVGTSNAKYAWQLAACDQGMDCSASSVVVQQSCLSLGICGPGDYRTNIQLSAVSPSSYQEILKAEGNINHSLSDGTIQKYLIHK